MTLYSLQAKVWTEILTFRYFLPITSLMVNRTISIKAMTISCKGEVFPMTTPNEIKTAAEAKSLSSMLKIAEVLQYVFLVKN